MKKFLLYAGYPRSGHTIVAAILNANPNVHCSNQLNLLNDFEKYESANNLFNSIENYSIKPNTWKSTTQIQHVKKRDIRVVGDKTAHRTTEIIENNPVRLGEFKAFVNLPIKWIHVVRNPWDTISTWSKLNHENKIKNGKKSSLKKEVDMIIEKYTLLNETIKKLKRSEDMLVVNHEKLITKMHNTLEEMCSYLEISFDPIWRDNVRNAVWNKPRITRKQIKWEPYQIMEVDNIVKVYPWLKGYDYAFCGGCNK